MTETPGGETPAEHPERDGFAVSAGATPQAGADDARASGSGAARSDATGSAGSDASGSSAAGPDASGSAGPVASGSSAAGPDASGSAGPDVSGSSAAGPHADPSARRARLQALAGVTVLGSDGAQVGRVRDIYVHDATGELAAITAVRRQLSSRSVLIPTAAIAVLPAPHPEPDEPDVRRRAAADRDADPSHPQELWLFVDAAAAREGLRPPDTLHASPQTLREAARAVGLEEAAGDGGRSGSTVGPETTRTVGPETTRTVGPETTRTVGPGEAAAG
ncbi:MAG: PRC-barrel domain-containing protein [Brachybacterium sp.]|uniref:PRC-barrel domain-containing protein n=1 Tax=Brachybacterium sp. TaxID=1891286 RepID=UPI002649FF58|nr:PRC-barrel domain-containing protein [Brachybacterium sp.]MDN5688148.1 PRC-barrel domain-containing protein [Brachybacterium sp.]